MYAFDNVDNSGRPLTETIRFSNLDNPATGIPKTTRFQASDYYAISNQRCTVAASVLHGPGLGPRAGPARSPWAGPGRA